MMRLLAAISIIIFLTLLSTYIFIPDNINISKIVLINCNKEGASRMLFQPSNWKKWWINNGRQSLPAPSAKSDSFIYEETSYKINKLRHSSIEVIIKNRNYITNTSIQILPITTDSIAIIWKTSIPAGVNPIKRVQQYQEGVLIKKNMDKILSHLSSFLEKNENIYGLKIQKTSTTDTLLIATKSVLHDYPTTPVLYNSIKMLQEFIAKKGARQTGAPMVNISKSSEAGYQYMVAVPTNTALKDEGNIFLRKMVKGNFLVTEVKGGVNTVNEAMSNIELFIADYKKTSMAIPFQSLITDRSKEADTAKWITKIYFPVYN